MSKINRKVKGNLREDRNQAGLLALLEELQSHADQSSLILSSCKQSVSAHKQSFPHSMHIFNIPLFQQLRYC